MMTSPVHHGPLGILDWGIGGLDLYQKLRASGSTRDVVYWSDSGAPPYGTLPAAELAIRVGAVVEQLAREGCTRVVVACNAASTVLATPPLRRAAEVLGCPAIGVIAPALATILEREWTDVAVIGGTRTIESGAYALPLRAAGCRVTQRVAQPLSALIERGVTEGPELDACLAEILEPLGDAQHLVLACTHYVAARAAIERRLPRLRAIIDPAAETLRWIERHWDATQGHSTQRFITTGSAESTRAAAHRAFGLRLPLFETAEAIGN